MAMPRIGDEVIVPPAGTSCVAEERKIASDDVECRDWFFCTKKLSEEEVLRAILKK